MSAEQSVSQAVDRWRKNGRLDGGRGAERIGGVFAGSRGGYAIGLGAVVLAAAIKLALDPVVDTRSPFLLGRERVDMLLSDIEMPGTDGYQLIGELRMRPSQQGGSVPAAALTAYARTEDRLRALRAGFQLHLVKPVRPSELVTVVASLAARRP